MSIYRNSRPQPVSKMPVDVPVGSAAGRKAKKGNSHKRQKRRALKPVILKSQSAYPLRNTPGESRILKKQSAFPGSCWMRTGRS